MNTILLLAASSVLFVTHCAAYFLRSPPLLHFLRFCRFIVESLSPICKPPSFPALRSGKTTSIGGIYWTGGTACSKHFADIYKTAFRDE